MPLKASKPPTSTELKFEFSKLSTSGETEVWRVWHQNQTFLGGVEWFSYHRQYVFCPGDSTSYPWKHLKDIAGFLEWLNARKRSD